MALVVAFGPLAGGQREDRTVLAAGPRTAGGHKTVGWDIEVSSAGDRPVRATIALRGIPGSFARSLVQGYYVEPLLSVVAAETGFIMLPSAGIVSDEGLDILIGRSGAGKSTLAARALAVGRHVIGDDQVIGDAAGGWRPFPRRLRFYPDLRVTAPEAYAALPRETQARLSARRLVAALSRGFVRPSLAVDPEDLGRRWDPAPTRAARILLLERNPDVSDVQVVPANLDRALAWAERVLAEQRSRLLRLPDDEWAARLATTAVREREILASAIAGVPVHEVRIPANWEAPRAIATTARALGLEA